MPSIEEIITEARTWKGTKWKHNHNQKGNCVDCINFLYQISINVGYSIPPIPKTYARTCLNDGIKTYLNTHFIEIPDKTIEPGRILLFKFAGYNNHVAIATSKTSIIHASQRHNAVVEHELDGVWLRILTGVWEALTDG